MKKLIKFFNLFIFTFCIALFANKVSAATVTMPTSSYSKFKSSVTKFAFNHGRLEQNESDYIKVTNDKIGYYKDASNYYYFYADVNNYNAIEYTPESGEDYLIRLYFKNSGNIGGRSVDAYVDVTRLKLGKYWEEGSYKPAGKKAVFFMVKGGIWVGNQYDTGDTTYKYSADQEIDVKVRIVWSDTQETVDLPFFTMQTDIDSYYDTNSNKTIEAWKAGTGYSGDYYVYSGNTLTQSSGKWMRKTSADATDGDNEYLKTGVFATTTTGEFDSTYYEGVCGTALLVTSQYINGDDVLTPVKASAVIGEDGQAKEKVNSINDKIVYTIKQNFGTQYVNTFDPYKSMSIKDVLPEGVTYESATITMKDGSTTTDITEDNTYGTFSYDESSHTLTYTFDEDFLSVFTNYKGQLFTIDITTSVKDANGDYENTATTYIDNASFDSNEVVDTYEKKSPTYEYISITDDMPLPEEISTKSGDFKVSDETLYLNDETVNRKDDIKVGTRYNVYDDNNVLIGYWELVEWDKDSEKMTANNVKFIGAWKFTKAPENPKTSDTLYTYIIMNLLSCAGIAFIGFKNYKQKKIS